MYSIVIQKIIHEYLLKILKLIPVLLKQAIILTGLTKLVLIV